jgi:hypothetical protein
VTAWWRALLEREPGIGLHGATGLRGRRNLALAWIRDARSQSRRAELVIGKFKAWMVDERAGASTPGPFVYYGYHPLHPRRRIEL